MNRPSLISISVVLIQSKIFFPSLTLTAALHSSPFVVLSDVSVNVTMLPDVQVSPVNVSVVMLFFIHSISQVKLSPSASDTLKLASRLSSELFKSGFVEFIAWSESTGAILSI